MNFREMTKAAPRMIPMNCAGHSRPGLLNGENSADTVAVNDCARHGIAQGQLDAEKRKCC